MGFRIGSSFFFGVCTYFRYDLLWSDPHEGSILRSLIYFLQFQAFLLSFLCLSFLFFSFLCLLTAILIGHSLRAEHFSFVFELPYAYIIGTILCLIWFSFSSAAFGTRIRLHSGGGSLKDGWILRTVNSSLFFYWGKPVRRVWFGSSFVLPPHFLSR